MDNALYNREVCEHDITLIDQAYALLIALDGEWQRQGCVTEHLAHLRVEIAHRVSVLDLLDELKSGKTIVIGAV